MTCEDARIALERETDDDLADETLARHLATCSACRGLLTRDARLADPLVAAAAAASRFDRRLRRAGSLALAASLAAVAALSVRLATRPAPEVRYVIQGDPSGVVLSGPGLARRSESPIPPRPKGDRL